jgi:hypothetical protein
VLQVKAKKAPLVAPSPTKLVRQPAVPEDAATTSMINIISWNVDGIRVRESLIFFSHLQFTHGMGFEIRSQR